MNWIRKRYSDDVTLQKMDVDHHFKDDDNLSITDEGGQNSRDGGVIELTQYLNPDGSGPSLNT